MALVLNMDPGITWLGYSICDVSKKSEKLVKMGLIRTQKSDKKQNVRVADDNFRRVRYISRQLLYLVEEYDIKLICFENFSPPRSASVASKLALVYGAIAMLTEVHSLPVAAATPQAIKKAVCGKASAPKEAIAVKLKSRYNTRSNKQVIQVFETEYKRNSSNWNHAWDSLGALVACADNDALRVLRSNG
jgi:Holliday junction resolvasome RuvABC endonuclease subunit